MFFYKKKAQLISIFIGITLYSSCFAHMAYHYKGYRFEKLTDIDLKDSIKDTIVEVLQKLKIKPNDITILLQYRSYTGKIAFIEANPIHKTILINPYEFNHQKTGVKFIIAHECMHILLNHTASNDETQKKCFQEKEADLQAAIQCNCAQSGIDAFQECINENKKLYKQGYKLDFSPKGNNLFDTLHPPLTERIKYLEPIAQQQALVKVA